MAQKKGLGTPVVQVQYHIHIEQSKIHRMHSILWQQRLRWLGHVRMKDD